MSGGDFTVDELARCADVSRRTVFNHFASLDEIIVTVGTEELEVLIERFLGAAEATPIGDGSRASMFDEIARSLRDADLASAIARVANLLGGREHDDARGKTMTQEAFARTATRLTAEVARRNPGADPLDVELLVTGLLNGAAVIAKRWLHDSAGTVDDRTRALWDALLDRLIASVRSGYLPEH
jgi:AcrR family transcriptional regulator